ncbi:MAG: hypothetical protein J5965_10155 [Aeriscardovia sp.]|nr:hypothetical protein [Aeriscardovia sp.]
MSDIIRTADGDIDWEANGWPEPNPGAEPRMNGLSIEGMPDDIYNIWMDECDDLDIDWGVDW